jgi:flagellar motor switch protein FliM
MRRRTRRLLWGLALLFAFILIWQKLRIVVIIRANFWQLLGLFALLAVAIYLVFEVLFGGDGR